MTKLWIMLAISLSMAFLIDRRDRRIGEETAKRREGLTTYCLILMLCLFCGLRTSGNDTGTYLHSFRIIPLWDEYQVGKTYDFASGFGFGVVTSILRTWGVSEQNYLMFFAFATVIPYVLFVRRYSGSMLFGVFLMFTTGFYTFSLAAIKQCVAMAICLVSVNAALEGKWIKYALLVALGALFHPYAIVYYVVPLLMFKPWTIRTFLYMGVFVAIGFFLEMLLGTVLDVTDMMGAEYTVESFKGEGVNIFRVAVSFVPMILAALYGKKLFAGSTKTDDLMFNLAMVNALIMFVGLFGTANYFARLANYFLPAQVVVLPWILRKTHPRDKAWLVPTCVVGYLGYFFYENAIIRPFEVNYQFVSLWDYIAGMLK